MENDTLELIDLEQLLEDNPKCESPSHDFNRVECSEDVAFRAVSCHGERNICANLGLHFLRVMQDPVNWCDNCGKFVFVCLRVYPI